MKKTIPYGIANYTEIVEDNHYFVDKTEYIATLEHIKTPIFLRPRRFGKSLLCSMLRYYYDINFADRFDELFGTTWIGQNPTGQQNQHIVISFDFSSIEVESTIEGIEYNFKRYCNNILYFLRDEYKSILSQMPKVILDDPVSANLANILQYLRTNNLPAIYLIIDEYDNFANQLITMNKDALYRELTRDNSFFKTFFKTLKEGRKTGGVKDVFITGVLPITIDELASGYNIGKFITLHPTFSKMLGFTQDEVDRLLDKVYHDYDLDPSTRKEVNTIIKTHYNGYFFVSSQEEALYNSTILMYFLDWLCETAEIPEFLTDLNLRTDLSWVRRITGANPANTHTFITRLTTKNNIPYDKNFLTTKFNMFQFFEPGFYPISFFYLGMLTRQDNFYLKLPNLNMRQIFVEYFNELNHIDVSTRYAEMMQQFVNDPNLEQLFTGYWTEYVSQLPEAIFQQVNENFYRTTFFELCSRYLSTWFTWNVERSYPQGKSDLEFVGKYHQNFSGLRWVIEFKYYSNAQFKKFKTSIANFQLQAEDTTQIAGYVQGLQTEYPEAQIAQYVIYCFGNQGFKVFTVEETS